MLEKENEVIPKLVDENKELKFFSINMKKELKEKHEECQKMETIMFEMKKDFEEIVRQRDQEIERGKKHVKRFLNQMTELWN